jgi:hypothetical protein
MEKYDKDKKFILLLVNLIYNMPGRDQNNNGIIQEEYFENLSALIFKLRDTHHSEEAIYEYINICIESLEEERIITELLQNDPRKVLMSFLGRNIYLPTPLKKEDDYRNGLLDFLKNRSKNEDILGPPNMVNTRPPNMINTLPSNFRKMTKDEFHNSLKQFHTINENEDIINNTFPTIITKPSKERKVYIPEIPSTDDEQ